MDIIQKFVKAFYKSKKIFLLFAAIFLMAGCCNNTEQPVVNYYAFKQIPSKVNTANNFRVCGNNSFPCANLTPVTIICDECKKSHQKTKVKKHHQISKQKKNSVSTSSQNITKEKLLTVCKAILHDSQNDNSGISPQVSTVIPNIANTSLQNSGISKPQQQNINIKPPAPQASQNISIMGNANTPTAKNAEISIDPKVSNTGLKALNTPSPQNPYFGQIQNLKTNMSSVDAVSVVQPQQNAISVGSNQLNNK